MASRSTGKRDKASDGQRRWLTWLLLGCTVVLGFLACVFLGGRQYILVRYYDQIDHMAFEIGQLRQEIADLEHQIEGMQDDSFVVESLARERMNYAVEGEVIFRFQ